MMFVQILVTLAVVWLAVAGGRRVWRWITEPSAPWWPPSPWPPRPPEGSLADHMMMLAAHTENVGRTISAQLTPALEHAVEAIARFSEAWNKEAK